MGKLNNDRFILVCIPDVPGVLLYPNFVRMSHKTVALLYGDPKMLKTIFQFNCYKILFQLSF